MDPPVKIFGDSKKLLTDLKMVLGTYTINCCILLFLAIFIYIFDGPDKLLSIYKEHRQGHPGYFWLFNIKTFGYILSLNIARPSIYEEIIYRGPVWLLAYYGFRLKIKIDLTWVVFIIVGGYLNYQWAITHTSFLPIFLIGIPAYILIIRTKNIASSMLCHFISNLSIYVLIQILLYFKVI